MLLCIRYFKGVELLDCVKLFAAEVDGDGEVVSLELDVNNQAKNSAEHRLGLVVNYDYGRIMGAAGVSGISGGFHVMLVLKEYGAIQIWDTSIGRIVNRLNLNKKVNRQLCGIGLLVE